MEQEYVTGRHPVMEVIRSGRSIHKIWVAEQANKAALHALITEAKKSGVIVQQVDRKKLEQMVGDVQHQGVVAQVAAYAYAELDDLLQAAADKNESPAILLLDELEDPHNLGSILRTAECTGIHGVVIPKRRSVGLTATVAKTSAGAVEYVPVARVTNLAQTIDYLKERGLWIAGADVAADHDVYHSDFNLPLAIVIGNEHKGIGRLIKEKCDFLFKLPMKGRIQSLNASVAAGVLMYELMRQRASAVESKRV